MTEIPPETIESQLDPIADLGTLEARRTEDSTSPKAPETMGSVAPVPWVNVGPFGRNPPVDLSNVDLVASLSTNMVATAMGEGVPAATVWNPIGSFSEIITSLASLYSSMA